MPAKDICYSDKYTDDKYEYRHVFLPKDLVDLVPKTHLMTESEWRSIGVQQSRGWVHYMIHEPEPHVLLFKRQLPKTEKMDVDLSSNTAATAVGHGGRGDTAIMAQR